MDAERMRDRFEKLDWQQQLGNLASTLARVSTRVADPEHDSLVVDLLQEAALFIEWGASCVPERYLPELAAMQREVLAWKRVWPLAPGRPLLALYARNRSDLLLKMAGVLDPKRH